MAIGSVTCFGHIDRPRFVQLESGIHVVRLRARGSRFSSPFRFSPNAQGLTVLVVVISRLRTRPPRHLSLPEQLISVCPIARRKLLFSASVGITDAGSTLLFESAAGGTALSGTATSCVGRAHVTGRSQAGQIAAVNVSDARTLNVGEQGGEPERLCFRRFDG